MKILTAKQPNSPVKYSNNNWVFKELYASLPISRPEMKAIYFGSLESTG